MEFGRNALLVTLICTPAWASAAARQEPACPPAEPDHVIICGDVASPLSIALARLRAMPGVTATADLHEGETATFVGVTLSDLLARASVPVQLQREDLTRYLVVEVADGYRVLFALPELQPGFPDELPLLAHTSTADP